MSDEYDDDDDAIDEAKLVDLTNTRVEFWMSKDRTRATMTIRDPDGLCDKKLMLIYRMKTHQMEVDQGVHGEHDLYH